MCTSNSINAECGLLHFGFANLRNTEFCAVATIAEKYNLTLVQYKNQFEAWFGDTSLRVFIYSNVINPESDFYILQVDFLSINFIAATLPPSLANGIETFVSPLDAESWTSLLLIVALVAGFLTCLGWRGAPRTSWIVAPAILLSNIIAVACILLG